MRDIPLQDRTTILGLASVGGGVNQITQDEEEWIDTSGITELGAVVECSSITLPTGATISLSLETAPTCDESLFVPIGPPIVFDGTTVTASTTPIAFKTVRTPSTMSPAGLVRWKAVVSSGASGLWGLTFRIRLVPGRSRFFVPTDITGNIGWFRADIGITKDSSNLVSAWADQSGLGHDLTASGSSRPTWVGSSIAGKPFVSFDPSLAPQYMKTAAFSVGTYTVIMVATGQDPASASGWFWTRATGAFVVEDTLYGTNSSTIYSTRAGATSAWSLAAGWGQFGTTTAKVLTVLMDGTHAGHKIRINGVEQSPSSDAASDPGTLATSDAFSIGARNDGVLPSKTTIAEVILYDHALVAGDLFVVEEYLRRRYALY